MNITGSGIFAIPSDIDDLPILIDIHDTLYVESFIQDFETNPNNKVKLKLIENNIHMWTPTTPAMLS